MIHGIFFKFIVHREKTLRGSFLCTTSPAPFCLFTYLMAVMTYKTKFGATARMNLGLIAGSLVTLNAFSCFQLFGRLKLAENDLFQMYNVLKEDACICISRTKVEMQKKGICSLTAGNSHHPCTWSNLWALVTFSYSL